MFSLLKNIRLFILLAAVSGTAYGSVTASASKSGSRDVSGYLNETNDIVITVDLDGDDAAGGASDKSNQFVYVELGFNSTSTVSTYDVDMASDIDNPVAPVKIGSDNTVDITITDSQISEASGWGQNKYFDFQIYLSGDAGTKYDVDFDGGSNQSLIFDTDEVYLNNYSYPTSSFNTYQVTYQPDENLSSTYTSTIVFEGISGDDNGTTHTYDIGTNSAGELNTGSNSTVTLTDVTTNGNLLDGSAYLVKFYMYDVAGNYSGQTLGWSNGYVYDVTPAEISGVSTSTTDGTYGIGDNISLTVGFTESVSASGTFQINLATGGSGTDVNVGAASISSATSVTTTYTVSEGENSSDLTVTSLSMVSGLLTDGAGNDISDFSIPTGQNLGDVAGIIIDGTRPAIQSTSSSSVDGSYSVDEEISIQLEFSEAVTLSGGNLIITLETGSTNSDYEITIAAADIINTSTVVGAYTVRANDASSDLAIKSISVSGGDLEDGAGNAVTDFSMPAGENISDDHALVIETKAPTIGSVTSTTGSGTYGIDSDINVRVNFVNGTGGAAESVTLSGGDLLVKLDTDNSGTATDGDAVVTISSISNATYAEGTYTVSEDDEAGDLTVVEISLSDGASIKDAAGNELSVFTIPDGSNLDDSKDIIVDGVRPTISRITSTTTDGTYAIGDGINVTIEFDKAVTLSGGNLEILLETGSSDYTLSISSISASTSASGTFTVREDDESSDLDVTSAGLSAGTLSDAAGNNMTDFSIPNGFNLADSKALVVDGIRPTITSVATTKSDGTYGIGESIPVTVNFSKAVTLDAGNLVLTLNTDAAAQVSIASGSISAATSVSGTYTVSEGESSSDLGVSSPLVLSSGTLTDASGNAMTDLSIPDGSDISDSKAIIIDGTYPTIAQISGVIPSGGTVVDGYYNSTNTGIKVTVPLENDTSLEDGQVQVKARVGANSYVNVGDAATITGTNITTGSRQITVNDTEIEGLTGYEEGGIISFIANVADKAGNDVNFTVNTGENQTIKTENPTITEATSSSDNGYYNIGDGINVSLTFSEALTLYDGNLNVTLNTGSVESVSSISSSTGTSFTYTVESGDESSDLTVSSISVDDGAALRDAAGNPVIDFSIPDGSNIDDSKAIVVDGIAPADFTVGAVVTVTDPVVSTHWNSYNTAVKITVPVANDASLVGGTIQLKGKVSTQSIFNNIRTNYTILSSDRTAGTVILTADSINVEDITSFGDGKTLEFTAVITDKAGNATTGTASGTTLIVDQTPPTVKTLSTFTATGDPVVSGYWNSSNTGISATVPIESDASLEGGTVQLQAKRGSAVSWDSLGAAVTITGSHLTAGVVEATASASGTADNDFEELTNFADDAVISVRSIVTDIAGNWATFNASGTTLTVDQTVPVITNVTASNANGYYNIGDVISVQVTASGVITVDETDGTPIITLETDPDGDTDDAAVDYSSGSGPLVFSYTIEEGQSSSNLNYKSTGSLTNGGGTLRDAAGNDLDLTLPALEGGNDLGSNRNIVVDGIYPSAFTVGSVVTTGGAVYPGYWNGSNTGLRITVPLETADASLTGGSIQIEAEADGSYENLGSTFTIVGDSVTAGSQTVAITAGQLESLGGFSDEDVITFRAVLTDIAGNATTGTASSTTLIVDRTPPAGFTTGDISVTGTVVSAGYWNSTDSILTVSVPVANDQTLVGGTIRILGKIGSTGIFEELGTYATITDSELDDSKTHTVVYAGSDSTDLSELIGFDDGQSLFVNSIITDVAGNSTTGTQSDTSLVIDRISPTITNVTSSSSNGYYKSGDTLTIQVSFSENGYKSGDPVLTLETGDVDEPVGYLSGDSTSTFTFRYVVNDGNTSADLTYKSTSAFSIGGGYIRDIAGNDLDMVLPAEGSGKSLGDNKNIIIDTDPLTATLNYENITQSRLTAFNEGKAGDVIEITATFSEPAEDSPAPDLDIQYADSTDDSFTGLSAISSAANDSTWKFRITLPDSIKNTGTVTVGVSARDNAGNLIEDVTSTEIFKVDNTPPADGQTGVAAVSGNNTKSGWINNYMDSIGVIVPIPASTSDPSLFLGGKTDVQMFNLTRGLDWVTIGSSDSIAGSGNNELFRTKSEIEAVLVPGASLRQGDSLIIRSAVTDRAGNITYYDSSANSFEYDILPTTTGSFTGGNITSEDTLFSTDLVTATWSEFTDSVVTGLTGSGLDRYLVSLVELDTSNNTTLLVEDSIFTDPELSFSSFSLNHRFRYFLELNSEDIAGNISETVRSDTVLRYNSYPVLSEIDSTILYEDIAYLDTVEVTDLDLNTLNGDSFTYSIAWIGGTSPTVGNIAIGTSTGIIAWDAPAPVDTGSFNVRIIVMDAYNLKDTLEYPITILPVNDAPDFTTALPDTFMVEDQTDSLFINLTSYISDEDNNDTTEVTWQLVILDTTEINGYPVGRIITGPNTSVHRLNTLNRMFHDPYRNFGPSLLAKSSLFQTDEPYITVDLDTINGLDFAIFSTDSNYFGEDHRVIFYAVDVNDSVSADTMLFTINAKNDPPLWTEIDDIEILENDSLLLDFGAYVTDVDDSLLTFSITALTNSSYMTITMNGQTGAFTSTGLGDTTHLVPARLWSDSARVQAIATDAAGSADTVAFTLDIIRVPRPHLSVSFVQNNAFSNYFDILVTDTVEKITALSFRVVGETDPVIMSKSGAYTYTGTHLFRNSGNYVFTVHADGVVGDTTLFPAPEIGVVLSKRDETWSGNSADYRLRLKGAPGSVTHDQAILVVDSSLFEQTFYERASYRIGNEHINFRKPVEISLRNNSEDLAIYRRTSTYTWEELPSLAENGIIRTYTEKMGYFRLGPKTIFVPEETSLHQNYPNPFNGETNIVYDLGFMDGMKQNVTLSIYNLLGQEVVSLVNEEKEIGRHTVRWNGRDHRGNSIASGVYFVRMMTDAGKIRSRKLMLIK